MNSSLQTEYLIDQIKRGDTEALNVLIDIWQPRVYNMALKMLNDHDDAMDVMQKSLIKVYKNINQLKDDTKFKSWLYRIVINFCKSDLRMISRIKPIQGAVLEQEDSANTPAETIEKKEMKIHIMNALQDIPPEQKIIIIMKEYEGLKFHEIASALDISINTAKSRLYYGLKSLKRILTEDPQTKALYYELYNK